MDLYAVLMVGRCSLLGLMSGLLMAGIAAAESSVAVPVEDYARYDQIVTSKFLTSDTTMVLIERQTTTRISPQQDGPLTAAWFHQDAYFEGALPPDLVYDFIAVNQEPVRLEGRFQFGVRYRFVSGGTVEEPEVARAHPVRVFAPKPVQAVPVLDRLVWSRIGYTRRQDQALVYVGNPRPDGTGAGFLVWLRRQDAEWTIWDTEVIWTVRMEPESNGPLLAP